MVLLRSTWLVVAESIIRSLRHAPQPRASSAASVRCVIQKAPRGSCASSYSSLTALNSHVLPLRSGPALAQPHEMFGKEGLWLICQNSYTSKAACKVQGNRCLGTHFTA